MPSQAQKYISVSSEITFFSSAPVEDISAINNEAKSAYDKATGEIVFMVPINKFVFPKSLMQEHFNEKYLHSEEFPSATFRGIISDHEDDSGLAWADGELEIHGVKQHIRVSGDFSSFEQSASLNCKFNVMLADYDIKIPSILFKNIAEEIEITVHIAYELFEN